MPVTLHVPHSPPQPLPQLDVHVQPPLVYVAAVWEYKAITRTSPQDSPPDEAELNALGAQGWELVGVAQQSGALHFYFKRMAR